MCQENQINRTSPSVSAERDLHLFTDRYRPLSNNSHRTRTRLVRRNIAAGAQTARNHASPLIPLNTVTPAPLLITALADARFFPHAPRVRPLGLLLLFSPVLVLSSASPRARLSPTAPPAPAPLTRSSQAVQTRYFCISAARPTRYLTAWPF